jgi:hypothetical protein
MRMSVRFGEREGLDSAERKERFNQKMLDGGEMA